MVTKVRAINDITNYLYLLELGVFPGVRVFHFFFHRDILTGKHYEPPPRYCPLPSEKL